MEALATQIYAIIGGLAPVLQVILIIALSIIFWKPIALKLGYKEKNPKRNEVEELVAEFRNSLQGYQMGLDELSQYANHETTEHTTLLREIRDSLNQNTEMMRSNFQAIHGKHDEWDRRGIPTADCKK